jgi:hypothetical protein
MDVAPDVSVDIRELAVVLLSKVHPIIHNTRAPVVKVTEGPTVARSVKAVLMVVSRVITPSVPRGLSAITLAETTWNILPTPSSVALAGIVSRRLSRRVAFKVAAVGVV